MSKSALLFLFSFLTAALQKSHAQAFTLLKDINETKPAYVFMGSKPKDMVDINGVIYFIASTTTTGYELWKTNGTAAGTVLVKDINPGTPSSVPQFLTNRNGMLFFQATDGVHGMELWKSDGTAAGTVMVKDVFPGFNDGWAGSITNVDGTIFFTATDGVKGRELWKSDGTAAGTVMVKDINPAGLDSSPDYLLAIKNTLYFSAQSTLHTTELWKSDGTAAGTVAVRDASNLGNTPSNLINIGSTLYYISSTPSDWRELWKSDGTFAGTVKVRHLGYGPSVNIIKANGTLFIAAGDFTYGQELWKSDGTTDGTALVKDINPGPTPSSPGAITAINNIVYFFADDGAHGSELWRSDGTDAGTYLVKDIVTGADGSAPNNLTVVNGTLFFSAATAAGRELWKSDGTPAGTVMVKDCNPGSSHGATGDAGSFYAFRNQLLFASDNGTDGPELWTSDGTENGTVMLKNINPAATGNAIETFYDLCSFKGAVFFAADDGIHGRELWRSDGTTAGTKLLKDINPGSGASVPQEMTVMNGALYFSAYDNVNGVELWKSDGTAAGTVLVKDIWPGSESAYPRYITQMAGALYFSANNGTTANGEELWKSDGTAAGTTMVKDIDLISTGSRPTQMTVFNNMLFFAASDANGTELWKSNGTAAGTVLVKDINAGGGSSRPKNFAVVNNRLYFNATTTAAGAELWSSDGTAAGTNMQVDLCPGTCSGDPRSIVELAGYPFYVGYHPTQGYEFRTIVSYNNGVLEDINPGPASSSPQDFVKINNTIYFTAENSPNGRALWKHDAVTGLSLVKKVSPGGNDVPFGLFALQGYLFFSGDNGLAGAEPWRSDGTAAGTFMIQDVIADGGSNPKRFAEANGYVFAVMSDATHGTELWVANLAVALPLTLLEFNGRIEQEDALLHWKTTGEQNMLSFHIERSTDGIHYSPIGNVSAVNNAGMHTYDYKDPNMYRAGISTLYYRLKLVDINGGFTYSRVVVLSPANNRSIVVLHPNPVVNELNVTISVTRPEKVQVRLFDNAGKKLRERSWHVAAGATSLSLDMTTLAKGVYFLQLQGETVHAVKKVVK